MATKVTLREKPISNGKVSLYLNYYPPIRDETTMKKVYKEFLGIYLFSNPKTQMEREYNKDMREKANAIWGMRMQSLVNDEYGFLQKHKLKQDFLPYFYNLALKENEKWLYVYAHFEEFVKGKCIFADITVDLCQKFREYLLNADQLKSPGVKLSQNSAAGYFSTFRGMLKDLHKARLLKENINEYLDRIDTLDTKREYLTKLELKTLSETPCEIPVLRNASIFACYTGLRLSDILALKWEDITSAPEGGYSMRITTKKTDSVVTLPVSEEALKWCGERSTYKVFKGLERSMAYEPLKKWIKEAGITKHITFHCFRHTFATLQLASGTNVLTLKSMLTHRNVSTTEIYTHIVDDLKRKSSESISLEKPLED